MAEVRGILGQSNPVATTLTDIYTVGADITAVISTIVVCNRAASSKTFRIAYAIAGAVDSLEQYTHRDVTIPANDVYAATFGVTLATTDVIRVFASTQDLSFTVFGLENTT